MTTPFFRVNRRSCRFRVRDRPAAALLLCAVATACGTPPGDARVELTVSAASSIQDVVTELSREFEAVHPRVRVRTNFAASGTLQQQIQHGAAVDVFLAAADRPMDALAARGLIRAATRTVVAANELVLVVPAAGPARVSTFADLAADGVRRIALGAPASVPAGEYARETLRHLGLWSAVRSKAIYGRSVRQVLTYVERGEVDAGLVYRTDAAASARVRVAATAPPGAHTPIRYPAAVLAQSAEPAWAEQYVAFLRGAEARAAWRRHGFRVAK